MTLIFQYEQEYQGVPFTTAVPFECPSKEEAEKALSEVIAFNKKSDEEYDCGHVAYVNEVYRLEKIINWHSGWFGNKTKYAKAVEELSKRTKEMQVRDLKTFCDIMPEEYADMRILTMEEWASENMTKMLV